MIHVALKIGNIAFDNEAGIFGFEWIVMSSEYNFMVIFIHLIWLVYKKYCDVECCPYAKNEAISLKIPNTVLFLHNL